ncbi:hypothetical protein Bca52824_096304, partial [Brassica carinata]
FALNEAITHQRGNICPRECKVCDGTFFPALLKELEDVCLLLGSKAILAKRGHLGLIQEDKDLVNYALINAVAIRKILKRYNKIHESSQGQALKTQKASIAEDKAFAFLGENNQSDSLTYSSFCQALRKKGLSFQETKELWIRADLDGNGVFLYEQLKKTWNMRLVDQSEKCKESVMEKVRKKRKRLN